MRNYIITAALSFLTVGALSASPLTGVCVTGFTNGSCGTQLAPGAVDGNWALSTTAETVNQPSAYVTLTGQFPFPPWLPNTANGQWIGPQVGGNEQNDAPGLYTYTETFNLSAFTLATVVLSGDFAADNSAEIFLNGVDTGIGTTSLSSTTPINLSSGFVQGLNTLSIVVTNNPGSTGNPSGLFVELSGNGSIAGIPEPGTIALLGLGLAGLGSLKFRRS
jgi:hypothetical protein